MQDDMPGLSGQRMIALSKEFAQGGGSFLTGLVALTRASMHQNLAFTEDLARMCSSMIVAMATAKQDEALKTEGKPNGT